ncbi:MAG: hypothetical protein EHM41_00940 [Chloroflexi bacterium]|nr:MAG: hypothetical protein EHM41_00940 [Chloroflexota bacterium]
MAEFTVAGVSELQAREQQQKIQEEIEKANQKAQARAGPKSAARLEKKMEAEVKDEELRIKRLLEIRIMKRFEAFPWLQKTIPTPCTRSSLGELKEIDISQKVELDLQGAKGRIAFGVKQGASLVEEMWGDGKEMTWLPKSMRLNLTGLSQIVDANFDRSIAPLVEETAIENPTLGMMSLEMRWVWTFATLVWAVHMNNIAGEKLAAMAAKPPMEAPTFSFATVMEQKSKSDKPKE